ncbi:MAG TPA: hypothetical protein VLX92_15300 [Kofleriaceae bacterium]|nr:hypothetical protein [Kofleriaceae bacterium]
MRALSIASIVGAVACGGTLHDVNNPKALAQGEIATPAAWNCGDTVLNDQLTTGGIRVTSWQPCWPIVDEVSARQREIAIASEARDEARRSVAQLIAVGGAACNGIGPDERLHSVFAHRSSIAEVIPHFDGGEQRGVRIIFKQVPGLTVDWVRRDIACQRARWQAFRQVEDYGPTDPTLVHGARVAVYERRRHVEVLIVTDTPEEARDALARAEGQPAPELTATAQVVKP